MPLPSSTRVVFKRNPLAAVSAEVRFPPILRIQVEPPVAFQDAIRAKFPWYEATSPQPFPFPPGTTADLQAAVQAAVQNNFGVSLERAHKFHSDDRNWTVQVLPASIGMSCKVYPRWEAFRDKFELAFNAFAEIYKPAFGASVGLRYQNVIKRSALGLQGVAWTELLQPFIAAEFGCTGLAEKEIVSDTHRFEFRENSDRILVQHGMATHRQDKELLYLIDNNFTTTEKVELKGVFDGLDRLNKYSGSLFRLCITDKLYNSLDPLPI
jgi:uncharacterized protein (TIGR04255 family)